MSANYTKLAGYCKAKRVTKNQNLVSPSTAYAENAKQATEKTAAIGCPI